MAHFSENSTRGGMQFTDLKKNPISALKPI